MGSLIPECVVTNVGIVVDKQECEQQFGQIIKMAIGFRQTTARFTKTTILDETVWQGLLDETDGTRLTLTESFGGFTFPASDAVKYGENTNETPGGIGKVTGFNAQAVQGNFINMPLVIAEQYRQFSSASGAGLLEAYFINEKGQVIGDVYGTNVKGFKINNWTVSDVSTQGVNAPNLHTFYFSLDSNWSKNADVFKPITFNVLDLLAAPVVS